MEFIGAFNDVYFGLGFACSILISVWFFTNRSPNQATIVTALFVKLVATTFYSLLVVYYFGMRGGADSWYYHLFGRIESNAIRRMVSLGTIDLNWMSPFMMLSGNSTERTNRLSAIVHFFVFDSFIASSFVFSLIGFWGQWLLYSTFVERYPHPRLRIWWKIGLLFFPSLTLWSAGLLKDPLGIFGLGCLIWASNRFLKEYRFRYFLAASAGLYILLLFREQILPVILISVVPWFFTEIMHPKTTSDELLNNSPLRKILIPAFILMALFIGQFSDRFSIRTLPQTIVNMSNRYSDSDFTVGLTVNASWYDLVQVAPFAVMTVLYRPFLWEAQGIPNLMASLENIIMLGLSLRALYQLSVYRSLWKRAWQSPLFVTSLVFVLIFAVGTGASTPNLGTLSRYRIPLLPFFVGVLTILQYHYLEIRSEEDAFSSTVTIGSK